MIDICCEACNTNLDDPQWTVKQARNEARKSGWHISLGRDICPDCWEQGER